MQETTGNIWTYANIHWYGRGFAICITTNGEIRTNGHAVMGRGVALQAAKLFPDASCALGIALKEGGNHVHRIGGELMSGNPWELYSFPVKNKWREKADLELIKRSAVEAKKLIPWRYVLLPKPGCGNGGLKWEDVKPIIEPILDDRFYIIDLDNSDTY